MNIVENPSSDFERLFIKAINERRKLKGNKPKIVITTEQISSTNEKVDDQQVLLTVKSIQTFLLSCIDKSPRCYSASWSKILRVQKLQQIMVIVLNGINEDFYNQWKQSEEFHPWKDLFTSEEIFHQFRFHSQPNISLIRQFSKIAAKTNSNSKISDSSLIKIKAEQLSQNPESTDLSERNSKRWKKSLDDQFSRVDLVLSLKQLIAGNYPSPQYNEFPKFKSLKSSYKGIHSKSRIFALDVETFEDSMNHRQVAYWLSVVDENLTCVYQTLIRTEEKVNQQIYLEKQSKVKLVNPEIKERTLNEVHQDLDELFDDDSILAGHSLENDLKYLQLYYPYIIDTSIIFNITGSRLEKSSLQKLYAVFFGRLIQKNRLDHDPTEDARATMELIQLKLTENLQFGDWFLGGVDQMKVLGHYDSLKLDESEEQCQQFLAQTKFGFHEDFFKKIKQQDKSLIIEQQSEDIESRLTTIEVQSNRQALKTSIEQIKKNEFIWTQLYFSSLNDQSQFTKINKYFRKIYQTLREDSIIIGMIHGNQQFSRCFIRIKDEEKFNPLIIDGQEFPYNLKLIKTS